MINFTAESDRELLGDLKEAGLVTPIILEAIHGLWDENASPELGSFLLAGAMHIDERDWLAWLIRRHGCYRFGPVRLMPDAAMGDPEEIRLGPNLPYAVLPVPQGGRRSCLVGVLRPDLPVTGLRAAATLPELKQLKADWSRVRLT